MNTTLQRPIPETTDTLSDVLLESPEFAAALEEVTTEITSLYIYTQ